MLNIIRPGVLFNWCEAVMRSFSFDDGFTSTGARIFQLTFETGLHFM